MELTYPPLAVDCRFDSNCPMAKKCTTHIGYSTLSTPFQKAESLWINPVCFQLSSQFSTSAQSHHTQQHCCQHRQSSLSQEPPFTHWNHHRCFNLPIANHCIKQATSSYKSLKVSWSFCFVHCNSIVLH